MKLIALDDQQQQYLLHVFIAYCEAGLPPSELGIASVTAQSVANAREVSIETCFGPSSAEVAVKGVALETSGSLECPPATASVRSRRFCRSFRKAPVLACSVRRRAPCSGDNLVS